MIRLYRLALGVAAAAGAAYLAAAPAGGQAIQSWKGMASAQGSPTTGTSGSGFGKPSPGLPMSNQVLAPSTPTGNAAHSMLDEPAASAKIDVSGNTLTILANNASLSELIRQVAARTGMQVEGNSRDQRVFGSYGPGNPEDVLTSLLYDSGYNVMMVGSTADGAPRRLVLSPRAVGGSPQTAAAQSARTNDEDDDEAPVEVAQPSPPPTMGAPAAAPGAPPTQGQGQVRTPQQMLEELQRMHLGQQPQDVPKE